MPTMPGQRPNNTVRHTHAASESDVISAFPDAMRERGLIPPADLIADGKLHRCAVEGEKSGKRSGSYLLHLDARPAGGFTNWKDGKDYQNWRYANGVVAVTPAERETWAVRNKAEREKRQRRAEATQRRAGALWKAATPAEAEHPYLVAKGVQTHGLRQDGDVLLVPMFEGTTKKLVTVQRISADGEKSFLPGGPTAGAYSVIGKPDGTIVIAEGGVTAATIHEATGLAVAVAFSCWNLESVARTMRRRYPDAKIIIAADDDHKTHNNPGVTAARHTAMAANALVAVPTFGADRRDEHTDFNDLYKLAGADAVKAAIEAAARPYADAAAPRSGEAEDDKAPQNDEADAEPSEPDQIDDDAPSAEAEPQIDDDAEIKRLAGLRGLAYDREREEAAKRLGVRASRLDKMVQAERVASEDGEDGLPEIEPWPDPVDGAALLSEMASIVLRHCGVPTRAEDAIALWTVHTHALDAADVSPRLAFTSPVPECGKSTALALVSALVPRCLPASNTTAAATFRTIEKWKPTFLIDEADTFLHDNHELRGVLNSGHTRSTAFVIRTVGDNHEPRRFATWGALAIGMIGKLPATLASRAIHIEMQRLGPGEKLAPLQLNSGKPYLDIARKAARWTADNMAALRNASPVMPEGFSNRRADNWRPLLAIAELAGGDWPELAREAALTLDRPDAGQTYPVMLLSDLRTLFAERGVDRLSSAEIVTALAAQEGSPWPEYGRMGKPITPNALGKLLSGFGLSSRNIRWGEPETVVKGYMRSDFDDVFVNYLPPPLS